MDLVVGNWFFSQGDRRQGHLLRVKEGGGDVDMMRLEEI